MEIPGVEPTNNNNSAERALRQAVIQRKISHGVQSAAGAQRRARLLTVVVSLRQQGRDVLNFLEQAWVAQRLGGVMPSLVPNVWSGAESSIMSIPAKRRKQVYRSAFAALYLEEF